MCRTKSVMQCTLHECPTHRGTRRVSQPKQGPCCSLYFRNVCRYPQSGAGHCLEIWHRLGSISAMPRFPSNAQIGVPDPSLLGMSSVSERTYRACSGSPAWTKSPPPRHTCCIPAAQKISWSIIPSRPSFWFQAACLSPGRTLSNPSKEDAPLFRFCP